MNAGEVKKGSLYWWKRVGKDGNPFETLVRVTGEVTPQQDRSDRFSVKVSWLLPKGRDEEPISLERTADPCYLTPFTPGDVRTWRRVSRDGKPYGTAVKVQGVEDDTGLIVAVDSRDESRKYRIVPRYLFNPAHLLKRSHSASRKAPAPAPKVPYATEDDLAGLDWDLKKVAKVVYDLATEKKPDPASVEHLARMVNTKS